MDRRGFFGAVAGVTAVALFPDVVEEPKTIQAQFVRMPEPKWDIIPMSGASRVTVTFPDGSQLAFNGYLNKANRKEFLRESMRIELTEDVQIWAEGEEYGTGVEHRAVRLS